MRFEERYGSHPARLANLLIDLADDAGDLHNGQTPDDQIAQLLAEHPHRLELRYLDDLLRQAGEPDPARRRKLVRAAELAVGCGPLLAVFSDMDEEQQKRGLPRQPLPDGVGPARLDAALRRIDNHSFSMVMRRLYLRRAMARDGGLSKSRLVCCVEQIPGATARQAA